MTGSSIRTNPFTALPRAIFTFNTTEVRKECHTSVRFRRPVCSAAGVKSNRTAVQWVSHFNRGDEPASREPAGFLEAARGAAWNPQQLDTATVSFRRL